MELKHFSFWCQKVLPLVYGDSLSYYETLCKVVDYINALIDQDKIFADEIDALKTEMSVVKAWVDRVNAGYHGEKIIFIGDSYGNESSRTNPWPIVFAEIAGLAEDQYINACEGGVGWTEKEQNNHNFLKLLQNAYTECQQTPYNWVNTEVTKIIVAGGVFRDLSYCEFDYDTLRTTVNNRISAFMTYARNTFPNAKVYYAFCSACLNYSTAAVPDYWQAMINNVYNYYYNASEYGYIFLPNMRYVLMQNYRIDTTESAMMHPSGLGGIALGTAIHNAVYGSWFDNIRGSVDVDNGNDNVSVNCRMRLISENGVARLVFRDTANVEIDGRALQEYELAKLPSQLAHRNAVNSFTDVEGIAFARGYLDNSLVAVFPVQVYGDGLSIKAFIDGAYGVYDRVAISPFNLDCERARIFENKSA